MSHLEWYPAQGGAFGTLAIAQGALAVPGGECQPPTPPARLRGVTFASG